MSKYKEYSEYKDSGVEWLGMVPANWFVSKLKFKSTLNMGQSPNSHDCNIDGVGLPFLQGNSEFTEKFPFPRQYCPIPRKMASIGNLLFSVRAPVGALNKANQTYGIGRGLCAIQGNNDKFHRLLWWILQSSRKQFDSISTGSTFEAISAEQLGNLSLPMPHDNEIDNIYSFLTHETAKIDQLIGKQKQLIELLKEKRQAVISHTVTKGLNPNVKMKDSRIEWLREIPEHWNLVKFSHCVSIRNGLVDPTIQKYLNYWLIAPNHIASSEGRIIKLETAEEQGADSNKYLCKKGEIIYSKIRPALVKACLCPANNVLCSADMYPMTGKLGLENNYLLWFLLSSVFTRFAVNQADRVAMPKINRDSLAECKVPYPSPEEQSQIINYLHAVTTKIDTTISQALDFIELIKERRSALISAAVTGKIDVRNWQPPKDAV